jgi:hypothetical protein
MRDLDTAPSSSTGAEVLPWKIRGKGLRLRSKRRAAGPPLPVILDGDRMPGARGTAVRSCKSGHRCDGGAPVTAGSWPTTRGSRRVRRASARKGAATLPPPRPQQASDRSPVTVGCCADPARRLPAACAPRADPGRPAAGAEGALEAVEKVLTAQDRRLRSAPLTSRIDRGWSRCPA